MTSPNENGARCSGAPADGSGAGPAYADAFIDGIPSGILIIDREFRIRRVNQFAARWLGRDPGEMVGQHCHRLMHARETPCPDCPCAISFLTGEPATVVHAGLDVRGAETSAEIIALPIRDASGEVVMALESVRDVTERERHVQALADAVERLETSQRELERRNEELERLNALLVGTSFTVGLDKVLSSLLAGALRVVGAGASGSILLLDGTARRLVRAASSCAEGEGAFAPCEHVVRLGECLCGMAALSGEVVVGANGGRGDAGLPAHTSIAVPLSASERVLGTLVIHVPEGRAPPGRERLFELMGRQMAIAIENAQLYEHADAQLRRKVTELTHALAAVERERARAQASERAEEELVTMLSHDLRSPLSVILQDAADLGRCPTEACRATAASIRKSVRRAAAMLTDVIDSARLEGGALELQREPIDLVAVVRELVENGFPLQDRARLRLAVDVPAAPVLGDRSWLERAAANVIGNALKFAPAETEVTVRLSGEGAQVRLEIVDRGPGIPEAELPLLFRRFFRASNARRTGGSGLGLYIARLVVEAHGGRMAVSSALGKGAAVALTLPARAQAASA